MPISLSFAMTANPRMRAVLDGRCTPRGIELHAIQAQAPDIFWRQLRYAEFDVSEMSISSLLMLIDRGRTDWRALPVFHDRRFFHSYAIVRRGSGVEGPEDLRGKHVGVPDYQQTAALWGRAILRHHFGVRPEEMVWHMERSPSLSHGGAVGFAPPDGVDLRYIPDHTNIGQMLLDGTLDAAIVYEPALLDGTPTLLDRSPQVLPDHAVSWLFADQDAERRRCFDQLGFVPANHCVVVRGSILDEHPWVALNLYEMFLEAKLHNNKLVADSLTVYRQLGLGGAYTGGPPEPDLYPYGLRANREMLESIAAYSAEQGLTSRAIKPEEYLAPSCLDL
ncbi:MAG: PhnD/SsuA/transferrin family substrate-binding protein [Actinophytocola sp.]|uniref:PhnD/SsuA/transferrin family substrate-binding protein n=1 Tax=Actinophytocola sp. TaxID=1872138 RepID=UPI00132B2128|nr:PhnD/SsuA/transferrin family substrate-binding protein [Actinophytocola sp.]MPZ83539.1 PhnD/SsuA/transferrin family substrate-binding protein [Actinophytocola sp.]